MKNEGYLLIDHRASPGITADDLKRAGITRQLAAAAGLNLEAVIKGEMREGHVMERATKRCCHCGNQVVLNPGRVQARSHCRKCDAYICDDPKCHFDCSPYRKMLDDLRNGLEKAARMERETPVPTFVTLDLPDEPAKEMPNG